MILEVFDDKGRNLTQAVNNLGDRGKVRTALIEALNEANLRPDHGTVVYLDGIAKKLITTTAKNGYLAFPFDAEKLIDHLIDGLTGGNL